MTLFLVTWYGKENIHGVEMEWRMEGSIGWEAGIWDLHFLSSGFWTLF